MTPTLLQKKVCLLGASAVGKTSLTSRFVQGIFNERYLTTIGVKIDKKRLERPKGDVQLMIWDINGEDQYQRVHMSYLRGMSGYFLVLDGTRRITLETALVLHRVASGQFGRLPAVVVINKSDVEYEWEINAEALESLQLAGLPILQTSAKTGEGIEEAFECLSDLMLEADGR